MNLPPLSMTSGFPPGNRRPNTTIARPGGTRLYCFAYTATIPRIANTTMTPTSTRRSVSSIPPPTRDSPRPRKAFWRSKHPYPHRAVRPAMDPAKREVLERQGYKVVGEHSGVKVCHWTKSSLTKGVGCYKETFYGIKSHRCLQMTPAVDSCNLGCLFCRRTQEWGSDSLVHADDPGFVVEESIEAQRQLLTGFKGNPKVSREKFDEAWHPNQVAISLTGEPTLYRRLGEMIDEFHRREMTTFLVTNGTTPAVLRRMASEGRLPTQLYVTVAAPNADVYRKLMAPKSEHEWEKLKETLALLPTLDTRTVIRHTLVEGWNLGWEDEYAALDAIARPMFFECKGYSFVGESRLRLRVENMPEHATIREFAGHLGDRLGYKIASEREDSRVVLLTGDGELHPLSR